MGGAEQCNKHPYLQENARQVGQYERLAFYREKPSKTRGAKFILTFQLGFFHW
jgi:hypothetical protein